MKLSKILKDKNLLHSITISPDEIGYKIQFYFWEKTSKGLGKRRTIKVKSIEEDISIPHASVDTVKHLGYKSYQYLKEDNFYLNFYK